MFHTLRTKGSSDSIPTPRSRMNTIVSTGKDIIITKPPSLDLNKYRNLIDIIAKTPKYAVTLGRIIDSADLDQLAKAFLNIGMYKGTTCMMINDMIKYEFKNTSEHTVLRGNTITTKMESLFCREQGKTYLKDLFGDIVLRIVTDCNLNLATTILKVEQLQNGIKPETRVEENRQRILDVAQEFVDRFTDKDFVDKMPLAIRAITAYTAEHASKHFPDNIQSYLGGFILLRLFNPAIVTPEAFEMLPDDIKPDHQDRQNLIAITRLLQKLSNQVLIDEGDRDEWINPFLERNMNKMSNYLLQVCEDPIGNDPPYSRFLSPGFYDEFQERQQFLSPKYIAFLHTTIYRYGMVLLRRFKNKTVTRNNKRIKLDAELVKLLYEMGTPITETPIPNPTLKDLFKKNKAYWLPQKQLKDKFNISPRYGHSSIQIQHIVYFFGGSKPDGNLIDDETTLLIYNSHKFKWTKIVSDIHPFRKFHSAASSRDGMYIFGGISNKKSLNDLWFFNFYLKEWKNIKYKSDPPTPRYGHTIELYDNSIYVFGGYSNIKDKYNYNNELWIFNLDTLTWTIEDHNNGPVPRMHHSSKVFNGSMWIFGGRTPDMDGLCDLYRYDFATNIWSNINYRNKPPSNRWANTMTIIANKFLIHGGCSAFEYYNDLYEFDLDTNTWKKIEIDNSLFGVDPIGLSFHSTIIRNGNINILFGGTYEISGTLNEKEYILCLELFPKQNNVISDDWKDILNQKTLSDACLIAEDRVLYVHLLVLYARNPYLYNIFNSSKTKEIEIKEITYSTLYNIMNYIYCGKIPYFNNFDETLEFIIWANRFDLVSLSDRIEEILYNMLNDKNLPVLLYTANKYNMKHLEVACITFLVNSKLETVKEFPFHHFSADILEAIGLRFLPSLRRY